MYKVMVAGGLLSLVAVGASILFIFGKMQDSTVGTDLCNLQLHLYRWLVFTISNSRNILENFKVYLPDQRTCLHEQSGGRIACQKLCTDWQWILLDTIYYCDCGGNLDSGISGHNGGELL